MGGFDLIIEQDEDEAEAAEVLVDVTIGGNKYRFLLDTGAARTSVEHNTFTGTFDRVGMADSSGVFAATKDDLVTLPDFELGPISKTYLTVTRVRGDSPGTKNLVGMDVLRDFSYLFLFNENRVLVDPDEVAQTLSGYQELALDAKYHPYVKVHLGHEAANAVWDTGAGITIADLSIINRHPSHFEEVGRSRGTDATGATVETPLFTMREMLIGGHGFPPHRVAGVDLSQVNATIEMPMDLILGYSTLCKANWFFDFPGNKWAITKLL